MRVIFCGGRDYADRDTALTVVGAFDPGFVTVIHGGAKGADSLVEHVAKQVGFTTEVFPAEWKRHGKAAGPVRNRDMLEAGADLVVAFPGGRGTADMVNRALAGYVPVLRVVTG